LYLVNLIKYNPIGCGYEASMPDSILNFKKILQQNNIQFTERFRLGKEIKAACGQLIADKKC
jgi:23S rRNA (adenine2503-C2)-methyltransferase